MQFLKGQSDILAVVIVVVLAIGLLGTAYSFGLPLIQKNQDKAIGERAKAFFSTTNINSLPGKITAVANGGGKDTAVLDVNGGTRIYPYDYVGPENNSIEFSFQSTVTSYAENQGWLSLSGSSCPPTSGVIGQDEPSVVCVRADRTTGGNYNITYRLYMRELEDAEKRNGYKIALEKHSAGSERSAGSKSSVAIDFDKREQTLVGAKTLITTYVKILLG